MSFLLLPEFVWFSLSGFWFCTSAPFGLATWFLIFACFVGLPSGSALIIKTCHFYVLRMVLLSLFLTNKIKGTLKWVKVEVRHKYIFCSFHWKFPDGVVLGVLTKWIKILMGCLFVSVPDCHDHISWRCLLLQGGEKNTDVGISHTCFQPPNRLTPSLDMKNNNLLFQQNQLVSLIKCWFDGYGKVLYSVPSEHKTSI